MSKIKTWEEIIFSKVEKTDNCWNWTSSLDKDGYGKLNRKIPGTRKSKTYRPHRIAYEIVKGNIPEGFMVCHSCDNRKCCNPEHLFLGTAFDNNHDMLRKNRAKPPKGEDHWSKKTNQIRNHKGQFSK